MGFLGLCLLFMGMALIVNGGAAISNGNAAPAAFINLATGSILMVGNFIGFVRAGVRSAPCARSVSYLAVPASKKGGNHGGC
jgi:hypothetical protein